MPAMGMAAAAAIGADAASAAEDDAEKEDAAPTAMENGARAPGA